MGLIEDASIQLNIGAVSTLCGKLSFSFIIKSDGDAQLLIYASDPSDMRKAGVLLNLDQNGYQSLTQLIVKTDDTIAGLQSSGQMKSMLARL